MTPEKIISKFVVDPETGRVSRTDTGMPTDSLITDGYRQIRWRNKGLRHQIAAHRVVWRLHNGVWPIKNLDHINGDRQDNRIANLREATQSQNAANTAYYKNNKAGYRGVSKIKSGRYKASIQVLGVETWLGVFNTARQAAKAYDRAALAAYGEFARLNNPYKIT